VVSTAVFIQCVLFRAKTCNFMPLEYSANLIGKRDAVSNFVLQKDRFYDSHLIPFGVSTLVFALQE